MSDFENEDDIFKKLQEEEDDVKPIDIGSGVPPLHPEDLAKPPSKGSPAFEDSDLLKSGEEYRQEMPEEDAAGLYEEFNLVKPGDYLDLLRKDPSLQRLRIGAGWEQRAIEEGKIDIDLSVFLLDRNDTTRADEDFVFYNNPTGLDGGCKHTGDSRTGAGEGDDETVTIDLNAISFDLQKIVLALSIYDEESKGLNFSLVRDVFMRLINEDDQHEICRIIIDDESLKGGNGIYMATLIREGPKWYFEANCQFVNGGLAEIATKYGIIVRELQSTG